MSSDPVLPPADPAPETLASRLRWLFVGREGLRAGWSALIFVVIFFAFLRTGLLAIQKTRLISHPTDAAGDFSLLFGFVNEALSAFAVLAATWILSRIERRGRTYGYGGERKGKLFLAGLGSGLILISLLVFALWKSGVLVIGPRLIFGVDVLGYGLLWFLAFCLVALFEESLTRGFLLYTLTRGLAALYRRLFKTAYSTTLGFWSAAVVMSVIFFRGHTSNPGESPVGLLAVFVGGMFFCYGVWRTGSIWWGIGMHAAWDWGQSFLFGVADSGILVQHRLLAAHPQGKPLLSGGMTGPEGSILVVGVFAVGTLIVFFTLPRGHYYDPPPAATGTGQPATAVA